MSKSDPLGLHATVWELLHAQADCIVQGNASMFTQAGMSRMRDLAHSLATKIANECGQGEWIERVVEACSGEELYRFEEAIRKRRSGDD